MLYAVVKLGFHVPGFSYLCHGAQEYAIGLPIPVRIGTHYSKQKHGKKGAGKGLGERMLAVTNTLVIDYVPYPEFY